ncbi:MAG: hypothetical protein ABI690_25545 [Chloroflexota bacterium]
MPRSTRLLILFSVLVVAATLFLLAIPNAAQTFPTPNEYDLTRTQIFVHASETGVAIGTSIPPEIKMATMQAAQATRTAIAITREPDLLTPQTPDEIELTATRIVSNYEVTMTSFLTATITEIPGIYDTATAIVDRATQTTAALTENPSLALTTYPTNIPASCDLSLINDYQYDLSDKVAQTALIDGYVNIVTSGVDNQCGEFYPLETTFQFDFPISDLSNYESLVSRIERILEVLSQNFLPKAAYGKVIRLKINFGGDYSQYKYVDTGYANALAAYAEGLRGDALIEALGGILDG